MDKTVAKAFRLFETLARAEKPQGVTELAKALRLTKSNVHRLLATLSELGYVRFDPTFSKYDVSLRLWEVANIAIAKVELRSVARPRMQGLVAEFDETCHLSVFDSGETLILDKIESTHPVLAYTRVGGRAPSFCAASGKVMLAYQPDEVIAAVAAALRPFTSRTITSPRALRLELAAIQRRGYSINRGEWRASVSGVAAPIRDSGGTVFAALGLSGPIERMPPRRTKAMGPALVEAANLVSAELGFIHRPIR